MTFIHKGHRLLINDLSIQEYGKSVEQMLKEIEDAVAKEEQLLAQQKAKEEQLLAQQKAKEEQLLAQQKAKEEQLLTQQKAKEEQLLAQQKAKEEQLLAQQKAKEEQLIVNMHQNLHINTQTIATICNIPLELVQQVLTQKGLI
jgi:hypothetical protein